MNASILLGLVLPVLVALAVASRGFVVDDAYVARWASSAGLTLTDENRVAIRRYLTWSRRLRTIGGLLGFLGPLIVAQIAHFAFRLDVSAADPGGLSSLLVFVGYLLGALVAELAINRPSGTPEAQARDSVRLADYLSHYLLVTQRGLGILCVILVGVYALASPLAGPLDLSAGEITVFGLVGVGVAAVIEGIQRVVIGRRQLVSGSDGLAVDAAKRSSTVHIVAGTGIALLLFFVAGLLSALLMLLASPTSAIGFMVIFILFPVSIFFWLDSGRPHGFRVRRRERHSIPRATI